MTADTAVARDAIITMGPQAGPQWEFSASPADLVFFGGAAGGGKSWALLAEPLKYIHTVPGFGAVFFRRNTTQITAQGGAWDEAVTLYTMPGIDGREREHQRDFTFPPYGNTIQFRHLEYDKTVKGWDSSQITLILWDQLESFTRYQFFYLLSRNRSTCGVMPYVRAGYNPTPPDDPIGGWIHEFVGWYLDENDEYPDPEKSGVIRWFINDGDQLHWFDDEATAVATWPDLQPLSFTFILSKVENNQILMDVDPLYLAKLKALGRVERERLLNANHKIKPEAGGVFDRAWFSIVPMLPTAVDVFFLVRYWDKAGTAEKKARPETATTAGLLLAFVDGWFYIVDLVMGRWEAADRENVIHQTALADAQKYGRWAQLEGEDTAVPILEDPGHVVVIEQEPGSGGLESADNTVRTLAMAGIPCLKDRPTGDKVTRAEPMATLAEHEGIRMIMAPWNDQLLTIFHNFPEGIRDPVDAFSGAGKTILSLLTFEPGETVGADDTAVTISPY